MSDCNSSKKERKRKREEVKRANYHDLEDLVYRMELTYDEFLDKLDIKYYPLKRTSYTLPHRKFKIIVINKTLEYSLHDIVKVSINIDDI